MTFLIVAFIAGVLTVLAPCILPLLPVVVGSSLSGRSRATPYVVVGSLAVSIILFTYLLKVSAAFIRVPQEVWTYLSGGIVLFFGFTLLFPALWERLPGVARLSAGSNKLVGSGYGRKSFAGDALIGAALGPVFSTCSPTYFVILASVLPASFALGTLYLLAYVLGLSLILLLIALIGQRFADRLAGVADSRGLFKRVIGILFVLLGLLIVTGYEKKIETALLNGGFFDVTKVEQVLLEKVESRPTASNDASMPTDEPVVASSTPASAASQQASVVVAHPTYVEIVRPSGFVNTDGITLKELVGIKVILVDFLTYSCINCQRTFPYTNAWYKAYQDQGLEIVGIHTPEFAFEKDINNVRAAMQKFGITYPIVLDNDYATWNAYGNQYWPRKYLVDIHGNIVYDHVGEGAYEETEMKIRELLAERARVLDAQMPDTGALAAAALPVKAIAAGSPETYFGSSRNEYLANGTPGRQGEQTFALPSAAARNALYLGGTWNIVPEYAAPEAGATVLYRYRARDVYLVAAADEPVEVEVLQDGVPVDTITVHASTLYTLVENAEPGEHTLELKVKGAGLRLYTFTFG